MSKAERGKLYKDENDGMGTVIRTTFITRELANQILRAAVPDISGHKISETGVLNSDVNGGFNQVGLGNEMLAKFKKEADKFGVYDGMYFTKP